MDNIVDVVKAFAIEADFVSCSECTAGHINSTFFVDCADGSRYVLQRINTSVFRDVELLMNNIVSVTSHIHNKLIAEGKDPLRGTLHFCKTQDGKYYHIDKSGNAWRLYRHIGGVDCYNSADDPEIFERVGAAFGHFQMQLSDYDASSLRETIPNFHNTPSRLADFRVALKADVAHRAQSIPEEIAFVLEREELCSYITDRIENGTIPLRVTHNDTKLNNLLIDSESGEPICVIDLDTIMPGSVLFDFGDAIRFGASSAAEDETDLAKVYIREDYFDAFTKGFVGGLENSLTETEVLELPMGALVITLELGIRFLTDYLNGDTYFRIHYKEQNLDRARNQFKLVMDMEAKMPRMREIVKKYL